MRLFLIPETYRGGNSLILGEKDYHYLIRVLRYKTGHEFSGRDTNGLIYNLKITDITESKCFLEVKETSIEYTDFPEIVLYQCICKGKKMDLIIRQATEAGVSKIIPVFSDFSISRPDLDKTGKIERWNKVIREAIQQSGSRVNTIIGKSVIIDELDNLDKSGNTLNRVGLFFHQDKIENGNLHEFLSSYPDSVFLLIGPEGGLSDRETKILINKNYNPVYLKTNILRAETAALYGVGAVQTILLESENWMLK
jgi:16S rRNA (uracil1498-N3)-methyltransferase